jgi:tetratricopeptide (TPR) repeat protein
VNEEQSKILPFPRRRVRDPKRVADFRETARRLREERSEAASLLDHALSTTPVDQWPQLAERPELRTCGVLERLAVEVDRRLDDDPQTALIIASVARSIARFLPPDYPPITLAQSVSQTEKDYAQALSYLARYDEALSAYDRAEAELRCFGSLAHDLAIVRFLRATTLQHLRRFDEAQAILEECFLVFRGHGDSRLATKCAIAAGNLLVRRGDHRAAREKLAPLLGSGDPELEILVRCTLGWCAIHLGEPAEALQHFIETARRAIGKTLHSARAAYGMGSALLRLGRIDDAVEYLAGARASFLMHGLVEEAGLSGLDLVEAHLLCNEVEEAKSLCAGIADEFAAANLNRRAIQALAYLDDCVRSSTATPEVVRNVQAYIVSLRNNPARECSFIQ